MSQPVQEGSGDAGQRHVSEISEDEDGQGHERAGGCLALPACSSFPGIKENSHDHSLILEQAVGLEDNEEKEGQKKMLTCSAQTPAVWELGSVDLQGCLFPAMEV